MHHSHWLGRLFEESTDPAFIFDPLRDQIVGANDAGIALLGYTREELLVTPVSHIHPADLPQVREFLNRVLEQGQGSTIKLTCRTKWGTFLPIEMALFAFGSGDDLRILGLVHDRSEHRQPKPGACVLLAEPGSCAPSSPGRKRKRSGKSASSGERVASLGGM